MATKPESKLQRKIQKALKAEFSELFIFKVHGGPFQAAGIPDLVGCAYGLFFGIEVKRPDGDPPTVLQEKTLAKIAAAGGIAGVATSPQEAIAIIRDGYMAHRCDLG